PRGRRRPRGDRAGLGVLLGGRADVQAAAAPVAVRGAARGAAAAAADHLRPGRADPRGAPGQGERADRQDRHPSEPRGGGARAVGGDARGVLRRGRHPRRHRGRGDGQLVRQQDERGEAAPRVGGAADAARPRVRGGGAGRHVRRAARSGGPPVTAAWVESRLGVRLVDGPRPVGAGLADLVGLAVRRNPRRAHLLVSAVLGKHVPTDPRLVYGSGLLLGELVRARLRGEEPPGIGSLLVDAVRGVPGTAAGLRDLLRAPRRPVDAVVVGYAETATALGHSVADALGDAYYLHSTRRP